MRYFKYTFTARHSGPRQGDFLGNRCYLTPPDCCLLSFPLQPPSSSSGMRVAGVKSQLRARPVPAGLTARTAQPAGINLRDRDRGCTNTRVLLTHYFPYLNWFHNILNLQNYFLALFSPFFQGFACFFFFLVSCCTHSSTFIKLSIKNLIL